MIDGWKQFRLSEEIDLAYGKGLPANMRASGNVKVYGSNGIVGHHNVALIDGPGIIIGRKGSVGEVVFSNEPFWPIDTTYYVINKGKHHWRFLFHLLRSLRLTELNSHTAVPGLNREDVYSIEVMFPDFDEQEQIAATLDAIENSINLNNRKNQLLTELEAAMHHKLMTGEIRVANLDLSAIKSSKTRSIA